MSSYRATAGLEPAPPFLVTDWLLRAFADQRDAAVTAYRLYVAEGISATSQWLALKNQVYLGSKQFVERALGMLDSDRPRQDVPRRQRRPVAKPLSEFASRYARRDQAIAAAYRTGAYSMQAIADHFGVGRMTVSRALKRAETEGFRGEHWLDSRGPMKARRAGAWGPPTSEEQLVQEEADSSERPMALCS